MTKKQKVMSALFNAPANELSKADIMWAASNLPDSEEKGTNSERPSLVVRGEIDHEKESLIQALGYSAEDVEFIMKEFEMLVNHINNKKEILEKQSKIVDYMLRNATEDLIFYFKMIGILQLCGKLENSTLSRLIKKLFKDEEEQ